MAFPTTAERHVEEIARTLERLCDGQPVGSVRIGKAYGMIHGQVLKYLRRGHEVGLVKPVYSDAGGRIRGWVPASGDATTLAERKAGRAAEAIGTLYSGKPVSARAVARHMKANRGSVGRWLRKALELGLVRKSGSG